MSLLSRRDLLAGIGGAALLSACSSRTGPRRPESLPSPTRPAGTPHPDIPIEHVVVLMMENHSFDNYFGMLGRGDGLTRDAHGRATNSNSGVTSYRMRSTCQLADQPSPGWTATHRAINGGRMDGFVAASGEVAMGYWDRRDIPFYYAMASTYALANRWFASVPGPT